MLTKFVIFAARSVFLSGKRLGWTLGRVTGALIALFF
jgi:hypothetical protein